MCEIEFDLKCFLKTELQSLKTILKIVYQLQNNIGFHVLVISSLLLVTLNVFLLILIQTKYIIQTYAFDGNLNLTRSTYHAIVTMGTLTQISF